MNNDAINLSCFQSISFSGEEKHKLTGRSKMKKVRLSDKSEVLARELIKKMRLPSQNYERLIEELIKDKFDKT